MWRSLLVMGEVHKSTWIIPNGLYVIYCEERKGKWTCFPKEQAWDNKSLLHLKLGIKCLLHKDWKTEKLGYHKRLCQLVDDVKWRAYGGDLMFKACVIG